MTPRRKPVSTSKYARILPSLKPLPVDDLEYQAKIDLAKATLRAEQLSPSNMAVRYRRLRAEKERIENELYDTNLKIEAMTQLLIESQEQNQEGWGMYGAADTVLRLASGDTLRVQPEPYSSIDNRDALRQFFIEKGLERLLTPSWQTVNSHNKERLLNGEPELPGTKVYLKTKLVFTSMKEDPKSDVTTDAFLRSNDDGE